MPDARGQGKIKRVGLLENAWRETPDRDFRGEGIEALRPEGKENLALREAMSL